nr:unnamed protein product [Digitaria exilis]
MRAPHPRPLDSHPEELLTSTLIAMAGRNGAPAPPQTLPGASSLRLWRRCGPAAANCSGQAAAHAALHCLRKPSGAACPASLPSLRICTLPRICPALRMCLLLAQLPGCLLLQQICKKPKQDGPSHTSPNKDRPDGQKKEKERRRKKVVDNGETLFMDAMENLWCKREKADELKELKKKERNDERLAVESRRIEMKQEV